MEANARSAVPQRISRGPFAALQGVVEFGRRKPLGAIGGAALLLFIIVAIAAPLISPHDPRRLDATYVFKAPSSERLLGGDSVGRDVLSRLIFGSRVSLGVGLASVAIGISLGALLGIVSAYLGGMFDLLVQRVVDAFLAFPAIILGLTIVAVLGSSVFNVVLALVFVLTPGSVRTTRAQALAIKEMDYVLAARAIGADSWRIVMKHLAPNCMAIFIILFTITLGLAIIVESSLSFLGVGVPPNVPSWGGMLSEAGAGNFDRAPWLAIVPGVAISSVVFAVNFLGDALRDVLDPRLRMG